MIFVSILKLIDILKMFFAFGTLNKNIVEVSE